MNDIYLFENETTLFISTIILYFYFKLRIIPTIIEHICFNCMCVIMKIAENFQLCTFLQTHRDNIVRRESNNVFISYGQSLQETYVNFLQLTLLPFREKFVDSKCYISFVLKHNVRLFVFILIACL